ncbi:MAG TPA: FKBP-type peptidyl-prolyl cis-trans isomerase [Dissulfurispiraceae bacterium]|nr:FKBP-type peptidyl-prolyl cis-trans isomerase [Dissulfurispiraceae bacterium]
MRQFLIAALCLAILTGQSVAEEKKNMSEKEKLSYSMGYTQGTSMAGFFKAQSIDVDTNTFVRALKEGLSGTQPAMTDQEMRERVTALQKELMVKKAEQAKALAEKNKKQGESFLAENKKKEGVITLPDGLQYKIITDGKGDKPKATDKVKVNYKGTLIDGTEFDSSYKRGEPAVFDVDKVIAGWTETLQLMKVGSKWTVYIPSALAYGERGAGSAIGPNQTLIFDIDLLSIEK